MKRQEPGRCAAALLLGLCLTVLGCPSPNSSDEDAGHGNADAGDVRLRRPDGGAVSGGSSSLSSAGTSSVSLGGSSSRAATSQAASGMTSSSSGGISSNSASSGTATSLAVGSSSGPQSSSSLGGGSSSSSSSTGGAPGHIYINSTERLYSFHPATLLVTDLGAFVFQDVGGLPITGQRMLDIALAADGRAYGVTYDVDTPAADFFVVTVDVTTRVARRLGTTKSYSALGVVPAGMAFPEEVLFAVDNVPFLDALRVDTGALRYSFDAWDGVFQSAGDVAAATGVGVFVSVYDSTNGFRLAQVDTYDGALSVVGPVGFPNVNGLAFAGGALFGFTREGNVLAINVQTGAGSVVATHAAEFVGAAGAP